MTDWPSIWKSIYEQINNHYREIAKKRDQMIAFYLILLAGVVGSSDKLKDFREAILTSVWIVGAVCFWLAIQYWRWHTVHTNWMVVVQRLMSTDGMPSWENCSRVWAAVNDSKPSVWRLANPLRGAETTVLYLMAVLTFIPGYLLARGTRFLPLHVQSEFLAMVMDVVPYSFLLVLGASRYVKRFHKFNPGDWPFRWLCGIDQDPQRAEPPRRFE